MCTGLAVECIGIDCITAKNGLPALLAYHNRGAIVTLELSRVRIVLSTAYTAGSRTDCHKYIIRRTSQNGEVAVIIIIGIMRTVVCS